MIDLLFPKVVSIFVHRFGVKFGVIKQQFIKDLKWIQMLILFVFFATLLVFNSHKIFQFSGFTFILLLSLHI